MAHNITDEEITRLAREYAIPKCDEFADLSDRAFDEMVSWMMGPYKEFLLWLLRSHCLVEKSVVKKLLDITRTKGTLDKDFAIQADTIVATLKTLFGDTLKEEGGDNGED